MVKLLGTRKKKKSLRPPVELSRGGTWVSAFVFVEEIDPPDGEADDADGRDHHHRKEDFFHHFSCSL